MKTLSPMELRGKYCRVAKYTTCHIGYYLLQWWYLHLAAISSPMVLQERDTYSRHVQVSLTLNFSLSWQNSNRGSRKCWVEARRRFKAFRSRRIAQVLISIWEWSSELLRIKDVGKQRGLVSPHDHMEGLKEIESSCLLSDKALIFTMIHHAYLLTRGSKRSKSNLLESKQLCELLSCLTEAHLKLTSLFFNISFSLTWFSNTQKQIGVLWTLFHYSVTVIWGIYTCTAVSLFMPI
jgi:hypothetical protein